MKVEIWILPSSGKNKDTPIFERRLSMEHLPRLGSEFSIHTPHSKRVYEVWRKDIVLYSGKVQFRGIYHRILLRRKLKTNQVNY